MVVVVHHLVLVAIHIEILEGGPLWIGMRCWLLNLSVTQVVVAMEQIRELDPRDGLVV